MQAVQIVVSVALNERIRYPRNRDLLLSQVPVVLRVRAVRIFEFEKILRRIRRTQTDLCHLQTIVVRFSFPASVTKLHLLDVPLRVVREASRISPLPGIRALLLCT